MRCLVLNKDISHEKCSSILPQGVVSDDKEFLIVAEQLALVSWCAVEQSYLVESHELLHCSNELLRCAFMDWSSRLQTLSTVKQANPCRGRYQLCRSFPRAKRRIT